ncbi:MAG: 2-hydroxy-3-oxopropionate reductase, partial [Gammaproteobacteria bacterium]|nr:2-hydroxy-3-oxopropionate reductase [Gammaproteobacteria bacterium]
MSKLGFIGLGIMGVPMAGHLIAAGHAVYLHSRSGVASELTEAGGHAVGSAKAVAE